MKKEAGIGIGIAVIIVIIAILFTNADDLVVSEIDEITSEIEFENPIQSYEINTKCELMLIHLDQVEKDGGAWPVDENELNQIMNSKGIEIQEREKDFDFTKITSSDELEKRGTVLIDEMRWVVTDYAIDYNSIDPKFKDYVHAMLEYSLVDENRQTIMEFYNFVPNDYTEDIECGKTLHEKYSDKLYDFTKSLFGESTADRRHAEIKSALYG